MDYNITQFLTLHIHQGLQHNIVIHLAILTFLPKSYKLHPVSSNSFVAIDRVKCGPVSLRSRTMLTCQSS